MNNYPAIVGKSLPMPQTIEKKYYGDEDYADYPSQIGLPVMEITDKQCETLFTYIRAEVDKYDPQDGRELDIAFCDYTIKVRHLFKAETVVVTKYMGDTLWGTEVHQDEIQVLCVHEGPDMEPRQDLTDQFNRFYEQTKRRY